MAEDDTPLSEADLSRLKLQDTRLVSPFIAAKVELQAKINWDKFYLRNENRFFKDRHWTTREFEQLLDSNVEVILEVGCGAGNLIYPLLQLRKNIRLIHACDFSPRAISLVKQHELYNSEIINAFVADLTKSECFECIKSNSVCVATLVFVLSAIHPKYFDEVVARLRSVLKGGGFVLFRDYGLHDMAQLRFKPGTKISDNFYVRQDGTRSYFFELNEVKDLFERNGFELISNEYVKRRTVNVKENVDVPRIFIQSKFKKI